MDEKSLNTLEFHKVLDILVKYTSFSAGEALARQLRPTTDLIEARQWQAETAEAVDLLENHDSITIGGARDVRAAIDNAERGFTLPAADFLDVRSSIVAGRNLRRHLLKAEADYPHLAEIGYLIEECPGLVAAIGRTMDDQGVVLDSASAALGKIRQEMKRTHGRLQDKLQSILHGSTAQYLQEPIITMRNGRYVLPLKVEARGRMKGIVHDHSGSGATLWMEPMATVELNNDYRRLQIDEQQEIERILSTLSGKVAEQGDAIKRIVERMAELDLIFARARYAQFTGGVEPQFVNWRSFASPMPPKHANERAKWTPPPPNMHPGSTIWIKGARHPLLDPLTAVPTNLTLDEETFIVLITGPNTGGKTVSLKTTGLMVLMAQAGLHLPAIEARLTIFEDVFADIGDEQSIEQSLSTFSAHISNIIRVLDGVNGRSLVIFDELGSGTDPAEGAALAQSITSYLRDKGATTFIATHYPELKLYGSQTDGAVNASLLFDIETLSPTYEMIIGIPGKSNAFAIARKLGLDGTILDDAMRLVGVGNNETGTILDEVYELREKIESQEAGTRLAYKQAADSRDALRNRLNRIDVERREVLAEAQAEAEKKLAEIDREIQGARQQLRDAGSLTKVKKVREQMAEVAEAIEPAPLPITPAPHRPRKNTPLKIGDAVIVKTLNVKGEILSIKKKEAMVQVGRLQMRAKLADLLFDGEPPAPEPESSSVTVSAATDTAMELDLRGKRVDVGLDEMERYLDSAFLSQLPWVRIIHGKGTGKLRTAVRQALKRNPHVKSWEEGKDGEGGAGVTVAKIVEG